MRLSPTDLLVVLLSAAAVIWIAVALGRALVISARTKRPASVTEEFSRGEKVRHRIRHTIAQRKAGATPEFPPVPASPAATRRAAPLDPFGGPARRPWWRRLFGSRRAR